jgi:hypothetical protein
MFFLAAWDWRFSGCREEGVHLESNVPRSRRPRISAENRNDAEPAERKRGLATNRRLLIHQFTAVGQIPSPGDEERPELLPADHRRGQGLRHLQEIGNSPRHFPHIPIFFTFSACGSALRVIASIVNT